MATMNDVAKLAKVSVATVSFAFNKPDQVKKATLQRVLNAAEALDYQPNMLAQGLKGSMSKLVAILVADIRLPIAATIAKGVEDVFIEKDYLPIIVSTRGDSSEAIQHIKKLRKQGVGGFIVLPSYFGIDWGLMSAFKEISEENVPIAFVGESGDQGLADNITYDSRSTAKQVVDHLISLGHRQIAYLGSGLASGVIDTRLTGYRNSHRANNLDLNPQYVEEIDIKPENAYQAMQRLFAYAEPPTAVFAINDVVALGVLDFCTDHDISIPSDLSIVTYDYQTLTRSVTSNLSSVVISGTNAGSILANLIIERQKEPNKPPQTIVIESKFEPRKSIAPPL